MKKKICYVTTISLTLKSFIVQSALYLKENTDWDIVMICDNDKDFAKSLPDGIRYIPVPMKRGISLDGISVINKLVKIFKKEKFDLVQYSTPNASLYVSIAAKIANIPIRLYCQWGLVYVGFNGIKKKIFKTIEKLVCSNSTQIEPDSYGNLKFAHSEGLYPEEKGRVIWNGSASGVSIEKFNIEYKEVWNKKIREKHNISENAKIFTFIGRITKDKGINELLAASLRLIEKCPDAFLLLVGDNENVESLNIELYNKSLQCDNIIYCGFSSEVEKYLAASDIYVLPSYREGFGSAVVEAEAMGVPVIISDIPGPTDAMQKDITGLVVPKENVEKLYEAMNMLYLDENMCKNMSEASYEFAISNFEQKKLFSFIKKDREELLNR